MVWRLTPAARASSAAAMPRRLRSSESRLSTRDAGVVLSLKSDIVVYTLPLPDSRFSPRLRPDGVGAGGTRRALRHGARSGGAAMPRRLRSSESRLSTRDAGVVLSLKSDIVVYTIPLPDSRFSPRLRPEGGGEEKNGYPG